MFICKKCLTEKYEWPKFEDWFSRSAGACEICGKTDVCADVQSRVLTLKDARVLWECAASATPGIGGTCTCGPITVDHEVVEIQYDVCGGVRAVITMPNTKLAHPVYVRSFRCAGEVVKAHLRSKAKQVDANRLPKKATWGERL